MKDSDDSLDLTLERRLKAPPAKVWRAMTEPELLKQWFAPRPWRVTDVSVDPRPGGAFHLKMAGPDDEPEECLADPADAADDRGCVLVAEPERRLVWTDSMGPEFRPKGSGFMTADIRLAPDGDGTRYSVRVLHKDGADRDRHREMGFEDGWGTCASQLDEVAPGL